MDSNGPACSAEDLQPIRQEALNNGGLAQARVTVETIESYQFGAAADQCVRGFYEYVTVHFTSSPSRAFSNYAFTPIQNLTDAQCDQLIAIAGPAAQLK
jgi:hypothetical protein